MRAFGCFRIPRGDGLKAVFSCEIPQTEDGLATCYKSMWRAAKERVIPVWLHIEESGSGVTRLCYLSGDPLYLVNANADSLAPSELLPVPPPKAPARSAPSLLTAVDLLALRYLVSVEWWRHGMGRDTDGLCLMGWARRHGFTYEWAVDTLKRGGTELPESYAYQRWQSLKKRAGRPWLFGLATYAGWTPPRNLRCLGVQQG